MRQIFSSQRVETVEGVAELLRSHGIEVKVTNGRSYKTRRRGQFSYTDLGNAQAYPAVWIVRADDQPRARDILREARLLDTTRRDHPTAEFAFRDAPQEGGSGDRPAPPWRTRPGHTGTGSGPAVPAAAGTAGRAGRGRSAGPHPAVDVTRR